MIQPQEIEVWYLLPAIRRKFARCMIKKHGLSQRKTASLMGITESAVSQYVNSKRAKDVQLGCELSKAVEISVKRVVDEKSHFVTEIQELLKLAYKEDVLCRIHKEHDEVPENCTLCGGR